MSDPVQRVADDVTLGMALVSAGKEMADRIRPAFDAERLRWRHVEVLRALADARTPTQQRLGEQLRLDPSVLVGLLNDLEGVGALRRVRDPDDRRRHLLELTETGRDSLHRVMTNIAAAEQSALEALSPAEQAVLSGLLGRVRARLSAGPTGD